MNNIPTNKEFNENVRMLKYLAPKYKKKVMLMKYLALPKNNKIHPL